MEKLTTRYGSWALVTGEQFAHQLAAQGLNIVVVARRTERLKNLADGLAKQHNVEVRTVCVDLTADDALEHIDAATSDIEIGLLVLNAGAAVPGAFIKQSSETRLRNIRLNVQSPIELTHHFAGKMIPRKKGGVIFVSSMVGYTGSPYMASYAASKSFILQFARAFAIEMNEHSIDVLSLSPGATRTEMAQTEGADLDSLPMPWMDASRVASIGLKKIGRKPAVIAGKRNTAMTLMMRMMPRQLALKMFGKMMRGATDESLR